MFQPWSGTATCLGFVTNFTSIYPHTTVYCFLVLPCHPPSPESLPICHPKTELHGYFATTFPPLWVLDCLTTWTRVHSRRPLPSVSEFVALLPPNCPSVPCRPLHPRSTSPFLPPAKPVEMVDVFKGLCQEFYVLQQLKS